MDLATERPFAPPEDNDQYHVGQVVRVYAGAPGTGYVDYEVTRIDHTGAWAVERVNTVRILEPWEVM